jgi:hypothetical protein
MYVDRKPETRRTTALAKASGEFLIQQGRMVADDVEGVLVKGSGHWLIDEASQQVLAKRVEFLGG